MDMKEYSTVINEDVFNSLDVVVCKKSHYKFIKNVKERIYKDRKYHFFCENDDYYMYFEVYNVNTGEVSDIYYAISYYYYSSKQFSKYFYTSKELRKVKVERLKKVSLYK